MTSDRLCYFSRIRHQATFSDLVSSIVTTTYKAAIAHRNAAAQTPMSPTRSPGLRTNAETHWAMRWLVS